VHGDDGRRGDGWQVSEPLFTALMKQLCRVLNEGRIVPFPSTGQQPVFHRKFPRIVPQNASPLTPDKASDGPTDASGAMIQAGRFAIPGLVLRMLLLTFGQWL
jgi:hypothetical protein